ncbi:MAG: efflux RND transporter periplasmic adaptor subunit [Nevskia sp.]|nr:efflux RND transporter periplasmic adaptor subunit [Nevskia sp.]
MQFGKRAVIATAALALMTAGAYLLGSSRSARAVAGAGTAQAADAPAAAQATSVQAPDASVDLNDNQIKAIKFGPAQNHTFSPQRVAVGSIDFDENLAVQVFPPYQGRIIKAYAEIGDEVKKGQTLFTIESPDLIQAESTLIGAAGVYELTTAALARAKQLYENQGIAQKDMEQAASDQQTAEGALRAARDAVRVFGKSEAEIDAMVKLRKIDPALVVPAPLSGRVTARFAQPGLLVQPGNAPAPYAVADLSTMWMLANVAEVDSPLFHVGQDVQVKVMAFPDRDFAGRITTIGATVDPATHTAVVRSEVRDPRHELRPGMFATYVIHTGDMVSGAAVPLSGVVREGDGTMSIWLTTDKHRFTRRTVKIGIQQDGFDQILDAGLQPGEQVVTDGAIFLSNMLSGGGDS